MNSQDSNEALNLDSGSSESYDKHRFTSEPKPKGNKFVVVVLMLFVLFIGAVGIAVFVAKKQVNSYIQQRAENAKANAPPSPEAGRKDHFFPSISASSAPLPDAFGEKHTSSSETPPSSAAIPVVTKGMVASSNHSALAQTIVPAPLDMMMPHDGKPGDSSDAISSSAVKINPVTSASDKGQSAPGDSATPAKSQHETVQDFAHEQALKSPVTSTLQVTAANLGNRSYLLARGAYVPCTLETQLVSNLAGPASCVLSQNIYSDDGKVVLMEKATHILGEYKSSLRTGDSRIAVLWTRIKTPHGVVIDVDSPASDGVGSAGVDGYVDSHWFDRIGAAFLLSLVDDTVALAIAKQSDGTATTATPQKTIATSKSLSEKVLESTINIPPTLYKNRGERIMVFVNRDLWFDSVYNVGKK